MMHQIIKNGWEDKEFIQNRTKDFDKLKAMVMQDKYNLENTAKISGIPADRIAKAAEWFAKAESACICYSMGITQHSTGVDNVKSIANLQMITGNLGRPGTGVNALRGQNNVQGACDMGCLPNVYSGYQQVINEEMQKKMKDAWGVDTIAEGKVGYTVTDMINIAADKPGTLKCLFIVGENPMLSDPDLHHVKKGFDNLDFVIVQDIFMTETGQEADVVLPAACYAEKDGTQSNTERRVQKWRKAQEPPGEAKLDWQITCGIAKAMGYEKQFSYKNAEEIFNEIRKVTPSYAGITYARLEKADAVHWPCPTVEHPGTPILHKERFATPDGIGILSPIEFKYPAEVPDAEYPLILSTGRCLWQFHTGSMTRRSEDLEREAPTGWVEICPEDAKALGIVNGEMVRAASRRGKVDITAKVTEDIKKGEVFIPFHFAECAANILTNNALDPIAKIPEYKACAVRIEKITGGN
jgi:formate dehydrogenase major subunit